jgi:hypothetical protein
LKELGKHNFLLLGNFHVFATGFGFLEDFVYLLGDVFFDFFLKKQFLRIFIKENVKFEKLRKMEKKI